MLLAAVALLAAGCDDLGNTVQPQAVCELSSAALEFGTVLVGQSATRTVTIESDGTGTLEGTVVLAGNGYEIVAGGGAFSLPPGTSRDVVIRFTPDAAAVFPGTLDLASTCAQVTLSGSGATQSAGALCVVVPGSVDFGFVEHGAFETASFQVFSVGTAPLVVDVVSNATDVDVLAGGGPGSLAPGASLTVEVEFRPQGGGRRTGTVVVGPTCSSVQVQGVGTTISFAGDLQPLFAQRCTGGNCHTFHIPTTGYALLYNAPSPLPGYRIIKPFEPERSELYSRIIDEGLRPPMPQNTALLPQVDRQRIRAWILEGATNN